MTFELKIDVDALAFIKQLPDKSQEIIDGKIKTLKGDPSMGKRGDKELLNLGKGKRFTVYASVTDIRYFTASIRIKKLYISPM